MSRTASSTNQALHYYRVVYPIRHCKRCSYFLGINEFQASEIINLVLVEIICLVVVGEKMFIFLFFREDFIWPSHHGPRVPVSGHHAQQDNEASSKPGPIPFPSTVSAEPVRGPVQPMSPIAPVASPSGCGSAR